MPVLNVQTLYTNAFNRRTSPAYGLTSILTGLESNRTCVGYAWPANCSPSTSPTCLPGLRRALLDEWCNIPQDQIGGLGSICLDLGSVFLWGYIKAVIDRGIHLVAYTDFSFRDERVYILRNTLRKAASRNFMLKIKKKEKEKICLNRWFKNSELCSHGLSLSVQDWNDLRPELIFRFPRIQEDSVSGEDNLIMSSEISRVLRGRETKDEREERQGDAGVEKQSDRALRGELREASKKRQRRRG
ncbi:uncharacterized protein TNCV_5139321 [Trichonephila clavipes]|nr:uncharacterized protein TNCV_5139321 [Trichonephila clavipes]